MKRKHYHKDKDTLHPLVECGDVRYIYIYKDRNRRGKEKKVYMRYDEREKNREEKKYKKMKYNKRYKKN